MCILNSTLSIFPLSPLRGPASCHRCVMLALDKLKHCQSLFDSSGVPITDTGLSDFLKQLKLV